MAIKQNMDKPIFSANNGRVYAIADEANDGIKAVPAEIVIKAQDDSTFTQVNDGNPLPVKGAIAMENGGQPVSESNPLPVSGAIQLTGSIVGYSYEDKNTIIPNPQRGNEFLELDTETIYVYDGSNWVVSPI